ncbi:hypothetical protein [uncultured Roseibium sp.]|uniref:hypothetical protein n=1 Tax=uncultured Roseibium sp. TaxID=1936171 RepID=UPI00260D0A37|nr:hypothetical protein [uncultured Roseibium sp.]
MRTVSPVRVARLSEGYVIPPTVFKDMIRSGDLIAETLRWEREQRENLHDELAAIRAKAHAEGLRQGLDVLLVATQSLKSREDALEELVTGLIETCLKRIFAHVPKPKLFRAIVGEVLEKARLDKTISIVCHPGNADDLRNAIEMWRSAAVDDEADLEILYETDDEVEQDHCEIYTACEIITVGIPVVIAQLVEALSLSQPMTRYVREQHDADFEGNQREGNDEDLPNDD